MSASVQSPKKKVSLLPQWVYYWVYIATALVVIDCIYVFSEKYATYAPGFIKNLWGWYGQSDAQYSQEAIKADKSNGWIPTQSLFNVFEVVMQLLFLFVVKPNTIDSVLALMTVSIATLWKTLIYMSIIYFSKDPVDMVPFLNCLGVSPLPENKVSVDKRLVDDSCAAHFFKFQFNFYWIVMPALVILACWEVIKKGSNITINNNTPAEDEDARVIADADKIANALRTALVSAFKTRELRDPSDKEVEELLEELTEERIAELLGHAPEGSSKASASPVKASASPTKATSSPTKATSSPAKATSSPAKATSSPVKATSSPNKRSPSPGKKGK